jgi:chorismate synthase
LGAVIDGCPPRLWLNAADIEVELARRRPGVQAHATSRREPDKVEILSGVFDGQTTGTPISLIIYNRDVKSQDYDDLRLLFRPGHGDFTYQAKYGIRDHRGGGRPRRKPQAGWPLAPWRRYWTGAFRSWPTPWSWAGCGQK